jgi:Cof subfamily protein (haloacid dehalogenase superfamily)
MIKAIFFDIDGTLIDPKTGKIPASTKDALEQLHQKGILLFLATGRPKAMADPFLQQCPFDGCLSMTGQYCYDRSGKILHANPIEKDQIQQLFQILEKDPFPCLIVEGEDSFMALPYPVMQQHFHQMGLPGPKPYQLSRLEEHPVYQLIVYEPHKNIPKLAPLKKISVTNACEFCYDVIPITGGKDHGIASVTKNLGIKQEEVMVFGDNNNDAAMLRWAGIGVAMGNGLPAAKEAANYVTDAVWDDGIAKAMKHFGLLS